jgi:signal transduction histidine kinase
MRLSSIRCGDPDIASVRISLRHSTSFRLMVFASLAFIAMGGAVIVFLYYSVLIAIDRQIDGALSRESTNLTAAYASGGYGGLRQAVAIRASPQQDAARLYLLEGPDAEVTGNLKQWPADRLVPGKTNDIEVAHAAKLVRTRTLIFGPNVRLLIGRALTERANFQRIAGESLLFVLTGNLLLGAAAGVLLARYADRRLEQINAIAQKVLEGDLSVRVGVHAGGDEYDTLAQNINTMLRRVERLVATVRGVTENIAHDLRTPLNALRVKLEAALIAPRSSEDYRGVLRRAIGETDAIVATFNSILKIARIKASALSLPAELADLMEVVQELSELYGALAAENGINLDVRLPAKRIGEEKDVFVRGDAHLISQAVGNLLDNAIKYSPRGSTVLIAAEPGAGGPSVTVADNGPGIPPGKRAAILDRFVRLEEAAGKEGFGLGLSFVAAVAEWHGARLELAENGPGLRATLYFPAAGKGEMPQPTRLRGAIPLVAPARSGCRSET